MTGRIKEWAKWHPWTITVLVVGALVSLLLATCGAAGAAATRTPDPTNLGSMERAYHCGEWFHGHKVRGYLIQAKYVPPVYSHFRVDEIPAETLVRWVQSGLFIEKCQR
jgi:hypothetical protein